MSTEEIPQKNIGVKWGRVKNRDTVVFEFEGTGLDEKNPDHVRRIEAIIPVLCATFYNMAHPETPFNFKTLTEVKHDISLNDIECVEGTGK
jgi:hypothetical protein